MRCSILDPPSLSCLVARLEGSGMLTRGAGRGVKTWKLSAERRHMKVLAGRRQAARESRPPSSRPLCVITAERPVEGGGQETVLSSSQGKKGCQEEEVVGSARPHPQAMWDVELKVSTRFSNKKVRGGRQRPAPGGLGSQSQTEGGGR